MPGIFNAWIWYAFHAQFFMENKKQINEKIKYKQTEVQTLSPRNWGHEKLLKNRL